MEAAVAEAAILTGELVVRAAKDQWSEWDALIEKLPVSDLLSPEAIQSIQGIVQRAADATLIG